MCAAYALAAVRPGLLPGGVVKPTDRTTGKQVRIAMTTDRHTHNRDRQYKKTGKMADGLGLHEDLATRYHPGSETTAPPTNRSSNEPIDKQTNKHNQGERSTYG
ncbi:unnamed protein product [Protopolystoma xenopodis]|uniref:Uncharacterized protein n=1 Tax=Protopolystoma xenopodis TaxID=117903 RepID=A0A3S5AAM7_9PLAT|nr:unnamed protein product [Protopolystoma xenopodis]